MLAILLVVFPPTPASAVGEGNVDGGGGGMGNGTSTDYWNTGDEGVRVTVVRASDHVAVTTPIDLTNKQPVIAVISTKFAKFHIQMDGLFHLIPMLILILIHLKPFLKLLALPVAMVI
jgi:hypothetical protein